MAPKRETAQERWGRELRAACEAAGITARELAQAINVAPATLSNWMAGRHAPHPKDVERVEKELKKKAPGYPEGYLRRYLREWVSEEESPEWSEWMGVEEEATELLAHEILLIPGLLQTPAYAQSILPPEKVEQRLARQKIFKDGEPPFFEALLDESILYRKVGSSEVMAEALDQLINLGERDDVIVRMIPLAADLRRFSYPFRLATVRNGKQLGFVEDARSGRILESPRDISELRRSWGKYSAKALSEEESAELIRRTIKDRWQA